MSRLDRIRHLNPIAIGVELVIVFVGVYLAFVLAEVREDRVLEDRRERVLSVLVAGVDQ